MLSQYEANILQIENIDNIQSEQIATLQETGICYLNLESLSYDIEDKCNILRTHMANFFKQDEQVKKNFSTDKFINSKENRSSSGYRDRRGAIEHLEMFHQNIGDVVNPALQDQEKVIDEASAQFVQPIATKFLEKLISSAQNNGTDKGHLKQMQECLSAVQAFIFYPKRSLRERATLRPRFNPHRDNGLLTLIMLNKPGLKFWQDGSWRNVSPKPGYCVLLIGDLLHYITQGKIQSCLHMVDTPDNEDRLSIVTFISSQKFTPLHLDVNQSTLHISDSNHKKRINDYNFTDRIAFKSIYWKLQKSLNLYCFSLLGLIYLKYSLMNEKTNEAFVCSNNIFKWSIGGLALINVLMVTFRMTYFETMLMDYLYHFDCPRYSGQEQVEAHALGRSALSFSGAVKSITFFASSASKSTSYWNAGFVEACVDKIKSEDKNNINSKLM